jgi:hypothetical protein
VRFRSKNDVFEDTRAIAQSDDDWETDTESDEDDTFPRMRPRQTMVSQKVYRLGTFALLLALMLPILQVSSLSAQGVRAGVIPSTSIEPTVAQLDARQDSGSDTDVCKRWAGQCNLLDIPPHSQANPCSRRRERNALHVWVPNQQRLSAEEQYLELVIPANALALHMADMQT